MFKKRTTVKICTNKICSFGLLLYIWMNDWILYWVCYHLQFGVPRSDSVCFGILLKLLCPQYIIYTWLTYLLYMCIYILLLSVLILVIFCTVPVNCDGHHTKKGYSDIAVKEEWKQLAECGTQHPCLIDVPWSRERQIDAAKQQIRHAEADYEGSSCMVPQFGTTEQCYSCYEVSWNK